MVERPIASNDRARPAGIRQKLWDALDDTGIDVAVDGRGHIRMDINTADHLVERLGSSTSMPGCIPADDETPEESDEWKYL